MEEDNTYNRNGLGDRRFNIAELRCAIDAIDEEILELINKRLYLAIEIGKLKAEQDEPIVDRARENNIVTRLVGLNKGPLQKSALQEIFTQLIAVSRDIQERSDEADK